MKNLRRLAIVLAATLVGGVGAGDIRGSAHDFSAEAWASGQVCIVCHTPHNAQAGAAPLWNHSATGTTFALYGSPTFNGAIAQPGGASKACLSCHDGTVALDAFGGAAGSTFLSGSTLLGSDLTNDHPVSFVFDSALAATDGGLHNPATTPSGLLSTIRADLLFNDKVECASCHDVHNAYNQPSLLVKSNAGSALCLTCHNK
jgi:predicted CXXCH cytochrome family protein